MDWSATAAWIALAVSIIAPTVSTLVTCYFQRKSHKEELDFRYSTEVDQKNREHDFQILDDFAAATGRILSVTKHAEDHEEYMRCYMRLATILPPQLRKKLYEIEGLSIWENDRRRTELKLRELIGEISNYFQEKHADYPRKTT